MGQKQRIRTEIGKDNKITIQLNQDVGLLEVLSLKLSQQDIYTSLCADYGVVCGRVSVNHGFGVPNARVSIFIPLKSEDENDPVISALYPYKTFSDKTEDGYRYNLLPARQQHSGHVAVGTFPDQMDILTREEVLEVYESYFKYTVKTNDAGDFMIWGVPLGEQVIHVDLDVSDMGCFSLRPDDFLRKGYGIEDFKSEYEFKSSNDIDSLPQIITFDKGIEVYPFWGNVDLCEIGITRVDFDLADRGLKVEPSALIIGGTFTDDGKNSVNKSCKPRKNMGKKCGFTAKSGNIDAIRFSPYNDVNNLPVLEEYTVTDKITDDGSFAFRAPMNRDFIYTNEFGENDYTNDPNKGIPTSSCYRFRFTLADEGLESNRASASYLVPNIREYEKDPEKSYAWSLQFTGYPTDSLALILNNVNGDYYPQDYFYRFQYGKVYTVSSFQSLYIDSPKRILGINDIAPSDDKDCTGTANTFPTNMAVRNNSFNFQLLLALVITFLQFVFAGVSLTAYEFLGSILKTISAGMNFWPFETLSQQIMDAAFNVQSAGQQELPLVIYDDCDECATDDGNISGGFNDIEYCKIAEYNIIVEGDGAGNTYFILPDIPNADNEMGTSRYGDAKAARDCTPDGHLECCTSFLIDNTTPGQTYIDMNTMVVEDSNGNPVLDSNGNPMPRFIMYIGGNVGCPIHPVNFLLSTPAVDVSNFPITTFTSGSTYYGFIFNDVQIKELFGIETGSTYFQTHQIYNELAGYTLDKEKPKIIASTIYTGVTPEEGCEMYDTVYNESGMEPIENTPVYLWVSGETNYGDSYDPGVGGVVDVEIRDAFNNPVTFIKESSIMPTTPADTGWTIMATVFYKGGQERLPGLYDYTWGQEEYNRKTKTGYSEFRDGIFTIVPSIDGPCGQNKAALEEWYRRKVIGLNFCGGVVNFMLADNWLSGSLYFFLFKAKIKDKSSGQKVKVCDKIVKYIPDQQRFYYKSCLYDPHNDPLNDKWGMDNEKGNSLYIGHPTTFVDLGPRDEFIKEICVDPTLDPNCSVSRSIGPTSFKSFGELIAFAINYKMDVANAKLKMKDFFKNDGFYSLLGKDAKIFNGDISQLISINSEAGIDGFDMQNQKYLGYSVATLDPENDSIIFCNGNYDSNGKPIYGPTPVTMKYETDGVRIRQCLNAPGYLTEASQKVPFYLWDKGGTGFGPYNDATKDDQCWDYDTIRVDYLQGMTYNYKFTDFLPPYGTGNTDPDDPFLLPPMSYDSATYEVSGQTVDFPSSEEFDEIIDTTDTYLFPTGFTLPYSFEEDYDKVLWMYDHQYHGFTILLATGFTNNNIMDPSGGRLYIRLGNGADWSLKFDWDPAHAYSIWQSKDPYIGNKQILSTPFLFYFGLRPGKTGLDALIQRFGPKGAFKLIE